MLNIASFNWDFGSWIKPCSGPADAILCIAGDWAPIRAFQPIIENTPEKIYGDLLPIIRSADLSIVNLEAPISDMGSPVCKSDAYLRLLTDFSPETRDALIHYEQNNHLFSVD